MANGDVDRDDKYDGEEGGRLIPSDGNDVPNGESDGLPIPMDGRDDERVGGGELKGEPLGSEVEVMAVDCGEDWGHKLITADKGSFSEKASKDEREGMDLEYGGEEIGNPESPGDDGDPNTVELITVCRGNMLMLL